ncbi:MAG TPA: aminotransferase class V-fold PLP-dependent enzyme, partial [Capillimicrobium sp.]|nr:aminotransferase class V-fold PLP-dependent enzyme [Capillimicrobium sp.]
MSVGDDVAATAGTRDLLAAAAAHAADWLDTLTTRPVAPARTSEEMLAALGGPLPDGPADPREVLDQLVADMDGGLIAMGSPRFFGWVVGGAVPASLAADWMTSAWDQNAGLSMPTPAVAAIEEVAGAWLLELLALPAHASFAIVTGCHMAHVTALAAARHRVLERAGWNVEHDGLIGAPPVRVLVGAERHVTVDRALRLVGLGDARAEQVDVDEAGAIRADALAAALDGHEGPAIVCAQAGNVNTGAIDPLDAIADIAHGAGAWVHVDGAFGLWAAASPRHRAEVAGAERADSWATDGHKVLNVTYDSGLAFVADRAAHRAAMSVTAGYLPPPHEDGGPRDPMDFTPEFSRRARGVPLYAALRSLGRTGVAELVDRLWAGADRFAAALGEEPEAEVLAHATNQVLVRFADDDARTDAVVEELQRDGTCFMTATTWRGRR